MRSELRRHVRNANMDMTLRFMRESAAAGAGRIVQGPGELASSEQYTHLAGQSFGGHS